VNAVSQHYWRLVQLKSLLVSLILKLCRGIPPVFIRVPLVDEDLVQCRQGRPFVGWLAGLMSRQ
jgi:hypothetical protein